MFFQISVLEYFTKLTGKHLSWSLFLNKFRNSHSQMFFKIVFLKSFANFTGKHCVGNFLIKLHTLRTATLLKRGSCGTCEIFKNTLFYWTSPVAAPDSFRFPACNRIQKEIQAKMFFCEFCKLSESIFWQNTSGWLLLKFISEFWEVFQNICFTEHLWETAYFKYKLQYFNQEILWKIISQVLFKHFIQEREVAIRRRSFT